MDDLEKACLKYLGRDFSGEVPLSLWGGGSKTFPALSSTVLLHQLWWVNYFLFLLNVLLPASRWTAGGSSRASPGGTSAIGERRCSPSTPGS